MTNEKAVKLRLKQLGKFLLDEYKEKFSIKHKNPKSYEKDFMRKIKLAIKNLNPLIDKAVKNIIVLDKIAVVRSTVASQEGTKLVDTLRGGEVR